MNWWESCVVYWSLFDGKFYGGGNNLERETKIKMYFLIVLRSNKKASTIQNLLFCLFEN